MNEIRVAVGVILNDKKEVLIALRPAHVHQGGLWEFPGGKIEEGETTQQALTRELQEELDITIKVSQPLLIVKHNYSDKAVVLDVYKVTEFTGYPKGQEGQEIKWMPLAQLDDYSFPKANDEIIEHLLEKY